MTVDTKSILVKENTPIREMIEIITKASSGLAIVVDSSDKFVGVVGDGDIRRALLKGIQLTDSVSAIVNRNATVAYEGMPSDEMMRLLNMRYRLVPVLDKDRHVKGILSYTEGHSIVNIKSKAVCVIGMGYVGLPMALTLADVGFKVYGLEINTTVLDTLRAKKPHFYEEGLEMALHKNMGKNFQLVSKLTDEVCDIYIISVGTPIDKSTLRPNLGSVEGASQLIASRIKRGDMVMLRSTVPAGTTRDVVRTIIEKKTGFEAGKDFYLVFAPERTIEGHALKELRELPQIIGGINSESISMASKFFNEYTHSIIDVGSLESAEISKIMDNTYRDVVFAYANQMALICEKYNVDMNQLVRYVNSGYKRNKIPVPSPGVGGACLSKDPYILMEVGRKVGIEMDVIAASRRANESMSLHVKAKLERLLKESGKSLKGSKIFIIGFAFKGEPETSDIRESPTLDFVKLLQGSGAHLFGYDPIAFKSEIEPHGVRFVGLQEGFKDADAVLMMNNHRSYVNINVLQLLETTRKPAVFIDGWHIFEPEIVKQVPGIRYGGIGND
ncbi:MAG TPA: nucleotide sugar dehydrogenase [Elusimicrobiota bacterium]|nr:nucleotide sugar dehydrogenase [Elusimicrobiota bacterium]